MMSSTGIVLASFIFMYRKRLIYISTRASIDEDNTHFISVDFVEETVFPNAKTKRIQSFHLLYLNNRV